MEFEMQMLLNSDAINIGNLWVRNESLQKVLKICVRPSLVVSSILS